MSTTSSFTSATHILTLAAQKGVAESQEACNALVQTGLQSDLFEAAASGALESVDRDAFRKLLGLGLLVVRLVINFTHSLSQMITAGKYDWVNPNITAENFPISGSGTEEDETKLFHFDRAINSDEAEQLIRADDPDNPWEPARIEHLLAFGSASPDTQRKFPIIELGSVALLDGNRRVAYLDSDDAERSLYLDSRARQWRGRCRFLAVRKIKRSGS